MCVREKGREREREREKEKDSNTILEKGGQGRVCV